jgi:hypothetical protein
VFTTPAWNRFRNESWLCGNNLQPEA